MTLTIQVQPDAAGYDVFRLVALVAGAALIAVVGVVVLRYAIIYRRHMAAVAEGQAAKWRGLLPRHVVLIGVSYVGLILVTMGFLIERLRGAPSPLAPILLAVYLTGFWAMWDVIGHQRHRTRGLGANP